MADNKAPKADAPAAKSLSKSAIFQALADGTNLTKKQVAEFFDALSALIKRELSKKGPGVFNVPGLVQLKIKHKPATKKRMGPNPFKPGEMMEFKAKPASKDVKSRALKNLKDMVK